MRFCTTLLLALALSGTAPAQEKSQSPAEGPTNEKAQKAFREGADYLSHRALPLALNSFKKADKEDGGRCLACQRQIITYGVKLGEWKAAENAAQEMLEQAQGNKATAIAHFELGMVLLNEGIEKKKDDLPQAAHEEMVKALAAAPNFPDAVLADGQALARLKQDDAAKARFEQFVKMSPGDSLERRRVLRYVSQPELARARMAPPFVATTLDGQRVSMDDLAGKIVLIDFWATWCPSCVEALPHMREIAKQFQGEPLVVLSVSVDKDESKWRKFIEKNGMTWSQCRDDENGSIAHQFDIGAIPHTYTIDADGVLQDEKIGDASIGKLKKLVARARELQVAEKQPQ